MTPDEGGESREGLIILTNVALVNVYSQCIHKVRLMRLQ